MGGGASRPRLHGCPLWKTDPPRGACARTSKQETASHTWEAPKAPRPRCGLRGGVMREKLVETLEHLPEHSRKRVRGVPLKNASRRRASSDLRFVWKGLLAKVCSGVEREIFGVQRPGLQVQTS